MSEATLEKTTQDPVTKRGPGRPPRHKEDTQAKIDQKVDYWCGVLPGSPKYNVTIDGHTFQTFREQVRNPEHGGRTQRTKLNGVILGLTSDQVRDIKRASRRLVIRQRGRDKKSRPYTVSDDRFTTFLHNMTRKPDHLPDVFPSYRRESGDEVIGQYLWMVPVSKAVETLGPMWASCEVDLIKEKMPSLLITEEDREIPSDSIVMGWAEDKAIALGYAKKIKRRKEEEG